MKELHLDWAQVWCIWNVLVVVVAPNDGGGKQLTNLEVTQDWRFPRLRHLQFLSHCRV